MEPSNMLSSLIWKAGPKMCHTEGADLIFNTVCVCVYSHSPSPSCQYGTELLLSPQLIAVPRCSLPGQLAHRASEIIPLKVQPSNSLLYPSALFSFIQSVFFLFSGLLFPSFCLVYLPPLLIINTDVLYCESSLDWFIIFIFYLNILMSVARSLSKTHC